MVKEKGIGMAVGREKEIKEAREGEARIQTLLGESVYYFPLSRVCHDHGLRENIFLG